MLLKCAVYPRPQIILPLINIRRSGPEPLPHLADAAVGKADLDRDSNGQRLLQGEFSHAALQLGSAISVQGGNQACLGTSGNWETGEDYKSIHLVLIKNPEFSA
jgi:hypothetical protein